MRPVHLRPLCALVGLTLLAGACGDDADDGAGIDLGTDTVVTTDAPDDTGPEPTEATVTTDETQLEPDDPGADEPATTLELNPPKTSAPAPPTTAGDPIGSDEALFEGQFDPGLDPFVELAIADLATRLGVDPAEITAVSAVLVTWSDSSIGCPLPDMQYAQALQDGSLIELEHDETVYRYHTGGNRTTPFLCDAPFAVPPLNAGGDVDS